MELYTVQVNGNTIQVADTPGEKGPILAIHGLTGTHKNMHYYSQTFGGDYRVISIDLRGRGNSSEADEDTSIFKHADDIMALLEALKIENPILLGFSMGAFISAIVASRLPSVQGLILLDGAATASEHQKKTVKPSLGRISREFNSQGHYVEETKKIYSGLGIEWTDVLQDIAEYEVEKANGHWENKSTESRILADFESFYSFNPKEIGPKITCPVLLVYAEGAIGSMPPLFYLSDYEETQRSISRIETVISGANHYQMVFEKRQDILQPVSEFLGHL